MSEISESFINTVTEQKKMDSKWANQRLEELLGFGKFQILLITIFQGFCSIIGAGSLYFLIILLLKQPHRSY